MSILDQQIKMSQAMINGETIEAHAGDDWVTENITSSQKRSSDIESDLISGFFPGGMYPDNRSVIMGDGIVSSVGGSESIQNSRTAAQLG
tara:strand:+ start:1132 stop:1401 length:270 start_codon:yes stop_codon:yes gene_type:complete